MLRSRAPGGASRALSLGSLVLLVATFASPAAAQTATSEPGWLGLLGPLTYPLEGSRWRLGSYVVEGEARPVEPGIEAWLRVERSRASGSTGCARFAGEARTTSREARPSEPVATPLPFDGQVAFSDLQTRDRACAEQTMVVANAVLDGLTRTAGYRFLAGPTAWATTLELLDEDAMPLLTYRVDDTSSLAGSTWLLDAVDGVPALVGSAGQPATIAFDEVAGASSGGNVAGSTGCGGFSASWQATGNVLSIRDLVTASDPCTPELTEQEDVVRDVLGATSLRTSFPPGALVLASDDDGRALRYRAAATLEGPTWLLDGRDAARLGGAAVTTLSLTPDPGTSPGADQRFGSVAGEGPCRTYTGTYRTDGYLVDLEGIRSGPGRCASPGAERSWQRILRRAVFAEIQRGRLRFRDRDGRVLATFDRPGSP